MSDFEIIATLVLTNAIVAAMVWIIDCFLRWLDD